MPPRPARTATKPGNDRAAKRRVTPVAAEGAAPKGGKRSDENDAKRTGKDKSRKGDKVIRDSFTMPAGEYRSIGELKKRCLALGIAVKKSELLRAGLAAIRALGDERLVEAVTAVESIKTGRPPGKKKRAN